MFTFNQNQNVAILNPNNYCGGYSLAAIALELNIFGNQDDPLNIYNPLVRVQNEIQSHLPRLSANTQNLIITMSLQGNGTSPLLPSTFLVSKFADRNYELYLNRPTFVQAAQLPAGIAADDIVDDEIAKINFLRLGNHLHLPQELAAPAPHQHIQQNGDPDLQSILLNNQYWLVLVLGGRHWVAIERDPNNGQYCIYNPAGGINAVANIAGNVITYTDSHNNAHTDNWSGIAISVA